MGRHRGRAPGGSTTDHAGTVPLCPNPVCRPRRTPRPGRCLSHRRPWSPHGPDRGKPCRQRHPAAADRQSKVSAASHAGLSDIRSGTPRYGSSRTRPKSPERSRKPFAAASPARNSAAIPASTATPASTSLWTRQPPPALPAPGWPPAGPPSAPAPTPTKPECPDAARQRSARSGTGSKPDCGGAAAYLVPVDRDGRCARGAVSFQRSIRLSLGGNSVAGDCS